MGPANSQTKQPLSQGLQEQLSIKHPKFNNLKVISLPTDDDQGIIEIIIPLPNEVEFKKWQSKVQQIGQYDNIFMPISHKFQKTQFCGSGGISTIQYKYYPYLLSDQIINRCNMQGKYFEEAELWYLVYSMILAGNTFHAKNMKLGDIRPQNIFISPEGQVRVATQYTWPGEQTNYQKTVFQKQTTYLQLKDISYGKLDQPTNFYLSESFSIGLTCLDAATLSDSSKLYQQNNKFNYNKLEERLQQLNANGYSEPLALVIKGLCQVQAERRANCKELAMWLAKYEESIIELQEFTVKELPEKLQSLRTQKPKDSRAGQPINYQYPPVPINSVPPFFNPQINRPGEQVVIKQLPQPISQQQYISQPIQNGTYVNAVPMVQSYYGQYQKNGYSQASNNNNPSIITFQKETNPRSNIIQNQPNASQLRGFNLQQIDQQLQMSRKLFPS